jgi:hypothetical protein
VEVVAITILVLIAGERSLERKSILMNMIQKESQHVTMKLKRKRSVIAGMYIAPEAEGSQLPVKKRALPIGSVTYNSGPKSRIN